MGRTRSVFGEEPGDSASVLRPKPKQESTSEPGQNRLKTGYSDLF